MTDSHVIEWTHVRIHKAMNPMVASKSASIDNSIYLSSSTASNDFLRAVETHFSSGKDPLTTYAFEDSRIVRTVRKLDSRYANWLKYCHSSDQVDWGYLSQMTVWLYDETKKVLEEDGRVLREKTLKKLQALCLLLLQTHRRFSLKKKYTSKELADLLGVLKGAFARDWGLAIKTIKRLLRQLDSDAISAFWIVIEFEGIDVGQRPVDE